MNALYVLLCSEIMHVHVVRSNGRIYSEVYGSVSVLVPALLPKSTCYCPYLPGNTNRGVDTAMVSGTYAQSPRLYHIHYLFCVVGS